MTPPRPSDADLVAACLAGDARSWDHLVARYSGLIYTIATRMGLARSDAEDVLQNVCIRLFQNLDDLRDARLLPRWLISMTKREVWRLRRRKGMPLMSELEDRAWEIEAGEPALGVPDALPETALLQTEDQLLVRRAVAELPENCRRLITLLYSDKTSLSYADVAQRLSLPLGSIGPTRARCLLRLRRILEELDF